jgi:hypothetical protein
MANDRKQDPRKYERTSFLFSERTFEKFEKRPWLKLFWG